MSAFAKPGLSVSVNPKAPPGTMYVGKLASVTNLPFSGRPGDYYTVGPDNIPFIFNGTSWVQMSAYNTPTKGVAEKETKLTWRGISITLRHADDISELFDAQYALTKEDMALFQMTYPDLFQDFRRKWAEKWAIERAKEEFDSWSDDYYEKKRR